MAEETEVGAVIEVVPTEEVVTRPEPTEAAVRIEGEARARIEVRSIVQSLMPKLAKCVTAIIGTETKLATV